MKPLHFEKKLAAYSLFSGAFILLSEQSKAQVIYTDLIPDLVFQFDGDFEYIDMNNDGINEFGFLKSSDIFSALTSPGLNTSWYYKEVIWAGPAVVGPAIVGESVHDSSAAGTYCFPYALQNLDLINNDLSFQVCGFQQMASKTAEIYYGSSFTILGVGAWHIGIGEWDDDNLDSTRFLGVRFKDIDNCLHYGWIRCAVVDSVDKLVVKDFAYEEQCNKPIAAGDTVSYVGVNNLPDQLFATMYNFGKSVYINLNTTEETTIVIFDIEGNCILRNSLVDSYSVIDMSSYPSGIYLISLANKTSQLSKKVILD